GRREEWRDLEADRLWSLVEGEPPRVIRADAPAAEAARRTSDVSEHAVVADLRSALTREQKRRFWQLKADAQQLFLAGRWEEAARVYAEMSALDPQHEDALYSHGNSLLELGRYAEAAERWQRLIEVNPASSRAWVQLGILHTLPEAGALFDLSAAAAAFESAHRINREESRPLVLWGEVLVAAGDAQAARPVLEAGYRMNSRDTSALYLGGYLAWQRGDQALARELLARARASFESEDKPAHAVLEGDTRSPDMTAARRKAAARRLFAECVEALRAAPDSPDPALAFSCVERTRASLPAPPPST
ncbi:MAG TPA: tetratricopeptide repeat protein, partial [Myxococcota bacterium]